MPKVRNNTQGQVVLNLLGGNSVTLMPAGSSDSNGPTDRTTLLDEEMECTDVANHLRTNILLRVEEGETKKEKEEGQSKERKAMPLPAPDESKEWRTPDTQPGRSRKE